MTNDNRDKFIYLAGRYGQIIKFYNVAELCADKIFKLTELIPVSKTVPITVAALYRLLIPTILSPEIEKAIYLDSDIVVNLDIKKLWQIELNDAPFAAVPEILNNVDLQKIAPLYSEGHVSKEDHLNSGVLLMNLNFFRGEEEAVMRGAKFVGARPHLRCLDQDILNCLYSKKYLKLPVQFNSFVLESRRRAEKPAQKIYHFAGGRFELNMQDPLSRLWMEYFIKSPWFDADSIGRLYKSFRQEQIELKKSLEHIAAVVIGDKLRSFILFEEIAEDVDVIVKAFSLKPDEEILVVKPGTPMQKIIDVMNASLGEKVFFIMVPNFSFQALFQAGFVYGRDFFDAYDFLSEEQGVLPNSYRIIYYM